MGSLPLAAIGLALLCVLALAMEIGRRWQGLLSRKGNGKRQGSPVPDHLLTAMLGLLALLLGFTFSLALNRYEDRRALVVAEANALGTAYLRSQLLEEPARERLQPLLSAYVDLRAAWSQRSDAGAEDPRQASLQKRIWAEVGRAVRSDPSQQLTRGLMDAVNESFDLAATRTAARGAHIPEAVLEILCLSAVLAALMLGYTIGASGKHHIYAALLLLLLLALALTMIFDLERSVSGTIQVSQEPMKLLRASMRQASGA
ncbi:hypothetical protein [Rhizorhabdus sp.]|uniref:bestrophin-like domain n=1 Tax=Rhizorhabdus sp. TaxID=1968843 RepID=UPI001B741CB9|nr:hypothetical protein [Rhizorhabdus sp.]MBP8231605.1 hypothetical protein [Rhizorhabdus sp.]